MKRAFLVPRRFAGGVAIRVAGRVAACFGKFLIAAAPIAACLVTILLNSPLRAQDAAPAAAAASPPPPPYSFVLPPGMKPVTIALNRGVSPKEYEDALRAGLTKVKPSTRPTTTASDLLQRLSASRSTLISDMSTDLGLSKDVVSKFLDGKLKPSLQIAASITPKVYVIVATEPQITAAVKAGWSAPLFKYNPIDNHTFYDPRVQVTIDRTMDDVVLWTEVKPGESETAIADQVARQIEDFDNSFPLNTAEFAMIQTRNLLIQFMSENVTIPLKLPTSESWFNLGLLGTMSSKYTSEVTGLPRAALTTSLSTDSATNPIRSAPLDLLNPYDPNSIQPQFLPLYVDAVSRKSAAVFNKLLERGGDGVVLKLVTEFKAHPPATNADLVQAIQTMTGVDLTKDLLPG